MVKKVYLSTLTGRLFDKKKQAQKYEDNYVKDYILQLEKKSMIARRFINSVIEK